MRKDIVLRETDIYSFHAACVESDMLVYNVSS